MKYFPEEEHLIRRNMEIQTRLSYEKPVGLRKMSQDAGEMFLLEYWQFDEVPVARSVDDRGRVLSMSSDTPDPQGNPDQMARRQGNSSLQEWPQAALLLHSGEQVTKALWSKYLPRSREELYRRDFTCPAGTSSCTSIARPNSCCSIGLACTLITDTGLGDVGCCSASSPCNGQVISCPAGHSACPVNQGGGCCIPGYQCTGIGCRCLALIAYMGRFVTVYRRAHFDHHCGDTTYGHAFIYKHNFNDNSNTNTNIKLTVYRYDVYFPHLVYPTYDFGATHFHDRSSSYLLFGLSIMSCHTGGWLLSYRPSMRSARVPPLIDGIILYCQCTRASNVRCCGHSDGCHGRHCDSSDYLSYRFLPM